MNKNTVTQEVKEFIAELNSLLKTASLHVEDAAAIVSHLVRIGVKPHAIVEHSGYVTIKDVKNLLDIAAGKLSPHLWLIACPGSPVLRKAPVKTQNHIINHGATLWNKDTNEVENIPVGKLTKLLAMQVIDNKGNIRTLAQQKKFLSSWTPPAKKPLYQVQSDKIIFNRKCELSKTDLRKLINAK